MDLLSLDWQPIFLSLKLAFVTTLILLIIGTPIAWKLSQSSGWLKQLVSIIVALPLVLPPTVIGFYLLILLSPNSIVGQFTQALGLGSLLFSFSGLVIGSLIYSLPFVVQPLQNAFEALGRKYIEAAQSLGTAPLDCFFNVIVPICRNSFVTAAVLGFAHTLGEFGVILMIGGSVPGETKVASVAIYEHVEMLNYQQAHKISAVILVISVVLMLIAYRFNSRRLSNG
ncbi:MAG: molybdate ABC transporter permease subunit [Kangiellaceae bacterium]|nr:molybdate ABC transporter permease subunit [Kangiellaceae bacterium]